MYDTSHLVGAQPALGGKFLFSAILDGSGSTEWLTKTNRGFYNRADEEFELSNSGYLSRG